MSWRTLVTIVICLAGPGLLLLSCAGPTPSSYWLVLYAFPREGQLLHSKLAAVSDTIWAGRGISTGYLEGVPVVLAASGVGMTNAAVTTQYLLDHYPIEGILFTGICGGISDRNKIGDIVIPELWVTHDYGYIGPDGFLTDEVAVGLAGQAKMIPMVTLPVDERLLDRVCEAAYATAPDLQPIVDRIVQVYCGGTGASGNQFIDQVEKRQWLGEEFDAEVVDMESAAVLQTALANGLPCVIIRSCSDLAGGSGSATAGTELEEFFQIAADNSAAVVSAYFKKLYHGTFQLADTTSAAE